MDKYEFNIKVEQIKKLVNRGDYDTAMKIADTIDWHRVRNASLLSMIAQIYEKNEEYQEAKDILLLAFERAPIGKRLLYKLADLALKEGSVQEAEAYYREFCDLAQDDPRQYLLRYLILKAKKAPVDQLIRALEAYTAAEVDEKWLYELAELYHSAGKEDDCVRTCDKIMLLFGLGKYVDKAMDLKLQYAPLTKYQMDLVENRDKYEAKLRAVEEEYSSQTPSYQEDYEDRERKELVTQLHEDAQTEKLAREMTRISEETRSAQVEEEDEAELDATRTLTDLHAIREIRHSRQMESPETQEDAEYQRNLEMQRRAIRAAKEREEMEEEALRRAEEEREAARLAEEERRAKRQAEIDRERAIRQPIQVTLEDQDDDLELEILDGPDSNHLMIEADTPEEGLSMALESLKKLHKELGFKNPVAKISSEKLNKRGISAVAEKLAGKDLIIEQAAGLTDAVQNELDNLMECDKSGMIVVLIDTPENLEELHARNTSLAGKFQYIGADEKTVQKRETEEAVEEALKKATEAQEKIARNEAEEEAVLAEDQSSEGDYEEDYEEESPMVEDDSDDCDYEEEPEEEPTPRMDKHPAKPVKAAAEKVKKLVEPIREVEEEYEEDGEEEASDAGSDYDDESEMDLDEFAQFACKYASEIDCSISGKSLLALYERIEMMEEDGVPLTRKAAVDLIEDAADKAEKPSIGKKITGLFSPKYDKEGLLILREDNFFD